MTLGHSPIDRLAEVARLSTLLSERVLDAVIMKRRVVPKRLSLSRKLPACFKITVWNGPLC